MLLLDSEALSAIAHGPPRRRSRVRALIADARGAGEPVGTVAAILAEVIRGRPADVAVRAALRREHIDTYPVDTAVGIRAGQLLGRVRAGSEMAVDAFLIAVADLAGGAVVATVDTGDLSKLAGHVNGVKIVGVVS